MRKKELLLSVTAYLVSEKKLTFRVNHSGKQASFVCLLGIVKFNLKVERIHELVVS